MQQTIDWFRKHPSLGFGLLVLVLSYFTYFHGYSQPAAFFWDENYHITHAQKYLNGIYHMHEHPPLGKLLMALGEKIIDANPIDNQFLERDYASETPDGFSFAGYRFFSALLSWLSALLFFGIFLLITRRPLWATLLSSLYIFDNALIVHGRGAMLDGPLVFFMAAAILLFFLILEFEKRPRALKIFSLLFGILFACAFTTKLVGLILLLLVPAVCWKLKSKKKIQQFLLLAGIGFFVAFFAVWQTHFALGKTIQPTLRNGGYFEASEDYRKLIDRNLHTSITAFPIAIRDSLKYTFIYDSGLPELNLCKPDENGSPVWFWPLGGRSINYRWETPDGESYRYLQLVANPASWWLGTAGVIIAASIVITSFFTPLREKNKQSFLLVTFLALYFGFMVTLHGMDRVLFLPHYFPPLHFSFILFALCFMGIQNIGSLKLTDQRKTTILLTMGILIVISYQFYAPLTYYQPLTNEQVERRAIVDIWELRCATCPRESWIATPMD